MNSEYSTSFIAKPPSSRAMSRAIGILLLAAAAGCFHERSFPMHSGDYFCADARPAAAAPPASTRRWLEEIHPRLRRLLPREDRPVMLTTQMSDPTGAPVDVYRWFDRNPIKLQGLFSNWWALQHTAQSIEKGYAIENAPALWPGFQDVWIPVATGVQLHGFLGFAEKNGQVIDADCIVVLPGLFGDNGAMRSRDIAVALRNSGLHVLSLEPRAHGQVEARYPNIYYTYGVTEIQDLMNVSDWLEDACPHVRRTGMIGFCWGANQALLAAWYDGRRPDDPSITPELAKMFPPSDERVRYAAGILAFSPVLRWEYFLDRMDQPKCVWSDPSPALFQASNKEHMQRKGFPEATGSLRVAIAYDFAYSGLTRHFPMKTAYNFIRLLDYRGQPANDKLESARVPTLIVHSVNDPLQTAQEVADLIAQTSNPNVAGLILPGGGHIGFQAYARRYFYSLILNFFDPDTGAAAGNRPTLPRAVHQPD